MTEYTVRDYNDLQGTRLSSAGKDRVLAAMKNGSEAILHVEEWVLNESDLQTFEGASRLVPVDGIETETPKAWLVGQDDIEEWVAKSTADLYRMHDDGIKIGGSPQKFLGDYSHD